MKNEEVIRQLSEFPMDMDVCVLDVITNADDNEDTTSAGIHPDFNICIALDDEQLAFVQDHNAEAKNFIALEFTCERNQEEIDMLRLNLIEEKTKNAPIINKQIDLLINFNKNSSLEISADDFKDMNANQLSKILSTLESLGSKIQDHLRELIHMDNS